MTPSVVVFDLGKVLLDFDYDIAAKKISARCSGPDCDVRKLIDHSPLLFRFETGLMTARQFYESVQAATGFMGSEIEFAEMFADIFSEMPRMIALNESLRARQVPTYIFSNTNPIAVRHIEKRFPFFKNFNGHVYSYEHGSMKPDEKIYAVVEEATGHGRDSILYLDDRVENVAAGKARGWQTILQEDAETTWARVRELGLLTDSKS